MSGTIRLPGSIPPVAAAAPLTVVAWPGTCVGRPALPGPAVGVTEVG